MSGSFSSDSVYFKKIIKLRSMAPPTVAEYYAGKSVFITGATGFVGKVLVEKLLRSCPDVEHIYMLMRPKKGQGVKERLDDFINCKAFDNIREQMPKNLDKLHVIPGDILQEELGMSREHREMLQASCQIVFHCAACVRFDMPLREALDMNTVGTQRVLDLIEHMQKLEVFVHVSTSYCRCELDVLEEKVYPAKHRPHQVIDVCKWMDDDLVNHMEPKLMEPQPNTYAYTKSLTEDLVSQYAGKFPIAIARPSIVTASYKEPMPGWVDNINGPTGIMIGAGKGVIRTMLCDENLQADIIPVDMVANGCILLGYTTAIDKPKEVKVCNLTRTEVNPLTWGEALSYGRIHVEEFPFSMMLWYPDGTPKTSWLMHQLAVIFTHILPAYFIDLLLFLLGKKTFMVHVQRKVAYGLNVLQYYTMKSWNFKNDEYLALQKRVTKEDNETFFTDLSVLNWSDYIRMYMKGAREYCMKEDPANLPAARRLLKQLYYVHITCLGLIYTVCAYLVYKYTLLIFSTL